MLSNSNHDFLVILEKEDDSGQQMFYAVVQLIGEKKEADNCVYELELSTSLSKLTWVGIPLSMNEQISDHENCLWFNTSTAELFAENGNLGINVTINQRSDPGTTNSR